MKQGVLGSILLGLGLLSMACSGGDNVDQRHAIEPPSQVLVAGQYQLVFSAAAPSTTPVSGIDLTFSLPTGVTVPVSSDGTGQILATALSPGRAITDTNILSGRFVVGRHQVQLGLALNPGKAWSGECLRLTVVIPAGVQVTEKQLLKTVEESFLNFSAVGFSSTSRSTITLTNDVRTSVTLQRIS